MTERVASLMYAIRVRVVFKYVAQLILLQASLILLPFCIALFYVEYTLALRYFAMSSLLTLMALPFLRLPVPVHVQTNEAFTITVITFFNGGCCDGLPVYGRRLIVSGCVI